MAVTNPFLYEGWTSALATSDKELRERLQGYDYPPFDQITTAYFKEAFDKGMEQEVEAFESIINCKEEASFDNTILPLELGGNILRRAQAVFSNLLSAFSTDELRELQAAYAETLSEHHDKIMLSEPLFKRIDRLYGDIDNLKTRVNIDCTKNKCNVKNPMVPVQQLLTGPERKLDDDEKRLVDTYRKDFIHSGASCKAADKPRLTEVNKVIAKIETDLDKAVLQERTFRGVVFSDADGLEGLDAQEIADAKEHYATARKEANEKGDAALKEKYAKESGYLLDLVNTTIQPSMEKLKKRESRKRVFDASIARGISGGPYDVREMLYKLMNLRQEKAKLQGFKNFAEYVLSEQTAKTAPTVYDVIEKIGGIAARNSRATLEQLKQIKLEAEGASAESGGNFEPYDWPYYAELLKKKEDEAKAPGKGGAAEEPKYESRSVLEKGVFYAAEQLYGIKFERKTGLPTFAPDVEVYEVIDTDGKSLLAYLLIDLYARSNKSGGAWVNVFAEQNYLIGARAVVGLFLNVKKPKNASDKVYLTWTDVNGAFHEFGHALHAMFNSVRYPSLTGFHTPTDYIEYPSQLNEMWATHPAVLARYATLPPGADPEAVCRRIRENVKKDEAGFDLMEYMESAAIDFHIHEQGYQTPEVPDYMAKEAVVLKAHKLWMPELQPRYHIAYFSHMGAGGYGALYYGYKWSKVCCAHSEDYINKNGGLTRQNGDRFRAHVLEPGNALDPIGQVTKFLGEKPDVAHLIKSLTL